MPPEDDVEQSLDRSAESGGEASAAEMARGAQEKPQDLKEKEEQQSDLRKLGRTPSSAGLPKLEFGADEKALGDAVKNLTAAERAKVKDEYQTKQEGGDATVGKGPTADTKPFDPEDWAVRYMNTREDSRDPVKDIREGLDSLTPEQIEKLDEVLRKKWGVDLNKDMPGYMRERLESNLDNSKMSDAFKQSFKDKIKEFENRTPPVSEEERGRFYQELNRLTEAKDPPPRADLPGEKDRMRLAKQVLDNATRPEGIFQGDHGTCGAAALESKLYTKNPSAAARMVAEVATTGKFTPLAPPDARPVEIHKSLVKADPEAQPSLDGMQLDGARNYASEIFQGSAMSLVTPGYRQERPSPSDPTDTGERSDEGPNPGLEAGEVTEIERQVTGNDKPVKVIKHSDDRHPSNEDLPTHVTSPEDLKVRLAELQRKGEMPIVIMVNTGEEPFLTDSKGLHAGAAGGAHFVTITHYDPATGKVSFDNSWREESDHLRDKAISADEMYRAMQK